MESVITGNRRSASGKLLTSFRFYVSKDLIRQYQEALSAPFAVCPHSAEDSVPPAFASAVFFRGYKNLWEDIAALGIERKRILHVKEEYRFERPLQSGEYALCEVRLATELPLHEGALPFLVLTHDYSNAQGRICISGKTTVFISRNDPGISQPALPLNRCLQDTAKEVLIFRSSKSSLSEFLPSEQICSFRIDPVSQEMIRNYAAASGDQNPVHTDTGSAKEAGLPGTIVHGMFIMAQMGRTLNDTVVPSDIKEFKVKFREITFCGESLLFSALFKKIKYQPEDGKCLAVIDLTAEGSDGSLKAVGELTAALTDCPE